ncbi:atlastin-3-like isoform X2 [Planococcus citri]|uniref:atlastin-3-like isoform X2 n=1 Tax=Planococcus citri TaxID=170843 RepID=UPI0031F9696B
MKDYPHAVPIVVPIKENGQHKYSLDEKALRKILLQDHIRDRNVVVVSIAGPYRRGKSFLLNFFLRYMNFKQTSGCDTKCSWLGDENTPLTGFPWKRGTDVVTTGILMWSEVFCMTSPTGEEVAVIFLDTQGKFDDESTVRDCVTVFALSTMLSSIQMYNLVHKIQEDDLQYLHMFTEYGRLASENTGNTLFQKLQFIVRDWDWAYEKSYGPEGGKMLLEEKLMVCIEILRELQCTAEGQHPEKIKLKNHIKSYFDDIQCFLLPDPGPKARTSPEFDGKLSDIDDEFKTYLDQLVPLIMAPENLIQKEIGGTKITVEDFLLYFKRYVDVFNGIGNMLPELKSIFDANVDLTNLKAVAAAKKTYKKQMEIFCETIHLNNDQFEQAHQISLGYALEKFNVTPKMGGVECSVKYRTDLQEKINNKYRWWKLVNESNKSKIGTITSCGLM